MPKNKKKNKKGGAPISDNEDDFGDGNNNDFDQMNDLTNNRKKKKKNKKKNKKNAPMYSDEEFGDNNEIKNEPQQIQSNKKKNKKKKKKKGKGGAPMSSEDELDKTQTNTNEWNDDSVDDIEPEPVINDKKNKKKKKKKKGKGAPISDEDEPIETNEKPKNDWNDDSEEDIKPEPVNNKKQKKKNKKKKKKGKGAYISSDEEEPIKNEAPKNDGNNWNDESEDEIKPQKNKKKNKKKKNKGKKQAQISDDDNDEDNVETQQPPKQQQQQQQSNEFNDESDDDYSPKNNKKKKKNKKKKNKNKGPAISDEENNVDKFDNESDDNYNNSKKNKKNKKKNKKNKSKKQPQQPQKSREEILAELKEQKQEKLLIYGNEKMENLELQFAKYFTDERKTTWEDALEEVITTFGEEEADIEDEEKFKEAKSTLDEYWEVILNDMQSEIDENRGKADEERKEKERLAKIEQFKRMGMSVGGPSKKPNVANPGKKKNKRKPDKNRLAELRKRLAEADKIEKEKEKQAELEKQKQKEKREQEQAKKLEQEKLKKQQMKASNWGDVDDSSNSSDDTPPANTKSNKQKPKSKPKPKPVKQKVKKIDDDSDDGGRSQKKKKRKRKKKNTQEPATNSSKKKATQSTEKDENKEESKEVIEKTGIELEMEKYAQLTKKELMKELRNRGISVGGKKDELLDRLKNDLIKKEREDNIKKHATGGASNAPESINEETSINKSAKKDKGKKKKRIIRSPICVVMGHVDTGKTKILDYIRNSKVQTNEVGGITQQIGATFLSKEYIKKCTARLKEQFTKIKFKVPGLLFIDTPGHESFANLRARGSSMCDIAILVVDIMHYLEPQTIESLKLLQKRKAPYIVALNKIDRCIDWKPDDNAPFEVSYKKQKNHTKNDFEKRLENTKLAFAKEGINSELYSRNKNMQTDVSLVPTSAHTGEGIPDLLYLLCQLTQKYMKNKLEFEELKFKASVLEVKQVEGYGSTIDVILSNGTLHPDDTIVVCGMRGPICSKIRALLLPGEAQEMRVKGGYDVLKKPINASMGIRIACQESLDYALAGSELRVVPRHLKGNDRRDVIEQLKDEVQGDYAKILSKVDRHNKGVYVQASTLGSLEALITFLSGLKPAIPISGIGIGNVHKADVVRASTCVDTQPEYAVILAFNIKIDNEARQLAEQSGVKIFEAEIIYHLQEMFDKYIKELREKRKEAAKDVAVFPVEMFVLSPEHVFHNKNPFVLGVEVKKGTLRMNTPIVAQRYNSSKAPIPVFLGRITSIRKEDKEVKKAEKGDKVSIKIEGDDTTKNLQVGRNFNVTDPLISRITAESIEALKSHFADEVRDNKEMVKHLFFLKDYFGVI